MLAGLAFAALLHGGALAVAWGFHGTPRPATISEPPVLMARIMAAPLAEPVPSLAPLPKEPPPPVKQEQPPPKPKKPVVTQKPKTRPQHTEPVVTPVPVAAPVAPEAPSAVPQVAERVAEPVTEVAPKVDPAGRCAAPEYPAASRRLQESGAVVVMFLIGPQGQVLESKIAQSSGFTRLDEAARDALSRCRFQPGTQNGTPTQAWAKIRYVWRLA